MRKILTDIKKLNYLNSVRNRYMTALAVLVLFAVGIMGIVSTGYTRRSVLENTIEYSKAITFQTQQNIDSYIDYMENIASLFAESDDVQTFLFSTANRGAKSRILSQFATILEGREDIRNLGIMHKSDRYRYLINLGEQKLNDSLNLDTQNWYVQVMEGDGGSVLTSSHVQHLVRGERPWVITLGKGIRNRRTGNIEGVFFIDLNYKAIQDLCSQSCIGSKGYVFLLDKEGNILYHPNQQQIYYMLQSENVEIVMNAKGDTAVNGSGSDRRHYTIGHSGKTGWTVVSCALESELLKNSSSANRFYLLMAAILEGLGILLSLVIARTITQPILMLENSMERVQTGDFSPVEMPVESSREITSLYKSFNVMTRKIGELMEQNVREQEEKRRIELRALQSQIRPHFLYNTLDSIIWMAEGKKHEEVVRMTSALAKLLRQSISNENEVVSIAEEIEYVRSYLTIQKMRYRDKLEYIIEVEPSVEQIRLMKMTLQPLIENAIYHGLRYKDGKGLIVVSAYENGDNAVVDIFDNGVGMNQETVEKIFSGPAEENQSGGIGVNNVQRRLQLYYGKAYGISYVSEEGEGTTATVTVPMQMEEKEDERV